jgi:hypothetical protein
MNAELVFFGRRVSMAPRNRRRILVALIYLFLAGMLVAAYSFAAWRAFSPYVIWSVIIACRLFLGGYAPGGLVKPFNGKAPKQFEMPSPLLALRLRLYPAIPGADGEAYRSDERELSQRDSAHYRAYQVLGASIVVPWFVLSLLGDPKLFGWSAATVDHLCAVLLLAILALFFTLPQAILLWSEPDMESEQQPIS